MKHLYRQDPKYIVPFVGIIGAFLVLFALAVTVNLDAGYVPRKCAPVDSVYDTTWTYPYIDSVDMKLKFTKEGSEG